MRLGLTSVSSLRDADGNFRRIETAAERELDVVSDLEAVLGTKVIKTGLSRVQNVVAGLNAAAVSGACFVVAFKGPNIDEITVQVYTSAFAVSSVNTNINWIATGVLESG